VRPELELEIPRGYHSTVDRDSFAAIHVLEDVASTRGAVFCDYRTQVTREMAEDMVDLLAVLHGQFYDDPRFESELRWVARYERWFLGGVGKLRVDYYNDMAFTRAADRIPPRLLARREEVWPAVLASLALHERSPRTFLHSDVHIGNWYQTGAGRMGLCDWQCAARGHFSRDLAYALSAALEVEDRRAWERELVRRYVDRLSSSAQRHFDSDRVFRDYRHQMLHALLMWTPTLCHSEHLPDMQPEAASLCMIERMTAAIDDLDSLDVLA
ncbi:MAG: aminoglycoside phosphotransferase family protein, partial [Myxococcota bacterium]